ncbi:hypothetical protein FRC07_011490, partial [Ceratobasidium sp. 392]
LRLDTWFNALLEKLLVWARSASPLPHLIVLHICYWWLLIVLHQSQYPEEQQQQQSSGSGKSPDKPASTPPRTPITELSIKMCDRAAHKIVQLIKMFDDHHGLRFFPRNMIEAICACGAALIREYVLAPPAANKKRATAANGVTTCVNALRAMSTTWPCANMRADDLERRLQERFSPIVPVSPLNKPVTDDQNQNQNQPDNGSDVSSMFYQHMYEWSLSVGLGSESSFEQRVGEAGWEGM